MKKKISLALLTILFHFNILPASSFESQWKQMQGEYLELCKSIQKNKISTEQYHHPFWNKVKTGVQKLIKGKPEKKFLYNGMVAQTMVRNGVSNMQKYEILHLKHCALNNVKNLLSKFHDTDLPLLPREIKEFDCSINTLGHLFYASKILSKLENFDFEGTIVELGGGYGNLARIFKMILPKSTIVIFDIPEFLALQSLFLRATLPECDIVIHKNTPNFFEERAIHLVPIFFVDDIEIDAHVFVSTFGISECPSLVQEKIVCKRFFDAELCYIVGQLNGWNGKFENHVFLFDSVRKIYRQTDCHPFHATRSYEMMGTVQ